MVQYLFKERGDMREKQPAEWKSVEQRYADLDIQAKGLDRRLVNIEGVVIFEYKLVKEFVKKTI